MDMWFAFALSKNGAPKQKDRMAFVGFLQTCRICGEGKNNAHTVFVDMVGGFPDVRQDHIEFSKSPPEKETLERPVLVTQLKKLVCGTNDMIA